MSSSELLEVNDALPLAFAARTIYQLFERAMFIPDRVMLKLCPCACVLCVPVASVGQGKRSLPCLR